MGTAPRGMYKEFIIVKSPPIPDAGEGDRLTPTTSENVEQKYFAIVSTSSADYSRETNVIRDSISTSFEIDRMERGKQIKPGWLVEWDGLTYIIDFIQRRPETYVLQGTSQ